MGISATDGDDDVTVGVAYVPAIWGDRDDVSTLIRERTRDWGAVRVVAIDSLPKTSFGKVSKHAVCGALLPEMSLSISHDHLEVR